jgi:hypothetical protein
VEKCTLARAWVYFASLGHRTASTNRTATTRNPRKNACVTSVNTVLSQNTAIFGEGQLLTNRFGVTTPAYYGVGRKVSFVIHHLRLLANVAQGKVFRNHSCLGRQRIWEEPKTRQHEIQRIVFIHMIELSVVCSLPSSRRAPSGAQDAPAIHSEHLIP